MNGLRFYLMSSLVDAGRIQYEMSYTQKTATGDLKLCCRGHQQHLSTYTPPWVPFQCTGIGTGWKLTFSRALQHGVTPLAFRLYVVVPECFGLRIRVEHRVDMMHCGG
jgi:hypothetical protein